MSGERELHVHLLPHLAPPERLASGLAVVVDVLRATTTIVHALAAGSICVRPCLEVDEAKEIAGELADGRVLLGGEREGMPLAGFDLGNSPREYSCKRCKGTTVVLTTSNGTRALVHAALAHRTLVAGFVNYSAICEQLLVAGPPIHILCAGTDGEVSLEDTLLAGALVDFLCEHVDVHMNDSARLAWDCFEHHGQVLYGALELGKGGAKLKALGYDEDIRAACEVDKFNFVPELRRDPLRIEIGAVGIVKRRWWNNAD
jgi:2-phosphosulfolactate phosphatase